MKILLVVTVGLLAGCTSTAGPFITNISSAGPGRLLLEKCEVEFSTIGYYRISNENCRTETVVIGPTQ